MKEEYKIYKSKTIINNFDSIVEECDLLEKEINKKLSLDDGDNVHLMQRYNVLTRYNVFDYINDKDYPLLYKVYVELTNLVKEYTDGNQYWVHGWMNYDTYDIVEDTLGKHKHRFVLQGYIAVEPKQTKTIFYDHGYDVENEIGNIYIGPGHRWHNVVNTEKYDGNRITFGYDLIEEEPTEGKHLWKKLDYDI